MSRQPASRTPAQPMPAGYRSTAQQPSNPSSSLYYATAGQQATQQGTRTTNGGSAAGMGANTAPGGSSGPGFPPLGGLGRAAPPGFGSRGSDSADFPALGSQQSHPSYAAQAQPQAPSTSSTNQLLPQVYMQGGAGLAPPPPPGIGASPSVQTNGLPGESLRGEDFPALGAQGDKERMGYLRSAQQPPSPSLVNGASTSQSTSATPSTNPPLPSAGGMETWNRHSPNRNEPIMRPVQQILSSPVDKWGLKALLYEIKMGIGKDRGRLLFGEELSELGVDLDQSDPLFTTFATPWIDQSSLPRQNITEPYHTPSCYHVNAPAVESKIGLFSEETLFYAFYMCPGDLLQLEAAEELFNRGWRFHMEMQVWMTSQQLTSTPLDLPSPQWVRGSVTLWDPRIFSRHNTGEDFMVDASQFEVTRPAGQTVAEERAKKEAAKSPNGPNGNLGVSHSASTGYGAR